MEFRTVETGSIPINKGRIIRSLANSTIQGILDAIVELVTNSDDSYTWGDQEGKNLSGRIDINIIRGPQGYCEELTVSDEAMGMDYEKLKKAIEFSSETSGFKEGKNVRGFFGRGLKEAIIALGKGEIMTLNDGLLSRAEIFYDETKKDIQYSLAAPIANLSSNELLEFGFLSDSGTVVRITVANLDKSKLPAKKSMEDMIVKHYSLRDINSSAKRSAFLHFDDRVKKIKYEGPIKYEPLEGKLVFEDDINVNDSLMHLKVFESSVQLDSPKSPTGEAGILIKAEGAILDNKLFGYETDPMGLYFFGEAICPGISSAIRKGDESIIDISRGGLNWRHDYNKEIENKIKELLHDLIKEKREKIESDENVKLSEPVERLLEKISQRLSDLAKPLLEDRAPGPGEIESFMIRPLFCNVEAGHERTLTVYAPKYLVEDEGTQTANLKSSNQNIVLSTESLKLDVYKHSENLYKATFDVLGEIEGEGTTITATLGRVSASCDVRVARPGKGGHKKKRRLSGGFFTKIVPAPDDDPIQRFFYEEEGGRLKIYTKFPGVDELLGENFENVYEPEGKTVLADIIIEAFSRVLSRKRAGVYFNEDVDSLVAEMDKLRKMSSKVVYETLLHADIKELIEN